MVAALLAVPTAAAQDSGTDTTDEPVRTTTTAVFDPDANPGYNSIIGSPEAGPEPEDAGDRGGSLQFTVFFVMLAGVLVVLVRVMRAATRHR